MRRDQCRRRGIEAQQRAAEATDTKIVKRIRRAGALVGGGHVRGLPAYSLGYVDFAIFIAMMPTILIATPLGVRAGHWLSETWLCLYRAAVRDRRRSHSQAGELNFNIR